jgi:hypothetical protein
MFKSILSCFRFGNVQVNWEGMGSMLIVVSSFVVNHYYLYVFQMPAVRVMKEFVSNSLLKDSHANALIAYQVALISVNVSEYVEFEMCITSNVIC